jgi:succinate dehydrogenase/fumarate reductase flavoprotein subunit
MEQAIFKAVIIGAGPAGLTAAYKLSKLNACGEGNSSSSSVNPALGTYTVQVQGTSSAQPNPVTIITAGLSVQ